MVNPERVDVGVVASDLPAPAPLPPPRAVPSRPSEPPPQSVDPPRAARTTSEAIDALGADVARRAWAMLADEQPSGLHLGVEADLARLAADLDDGHELGEMARRAGRSTRDLASLASAWRYGGRDGVQVLTEPWAPSDEEMSEGREALLSFVESISGATGRPRVRDNSVTLDGSQLRLGQDRRWYLFDRVDGNARLWDLVGPPAEDPFDLVSDNGR